MPHKPEGQEPVTMHFCDERAGNIRQDIKGVKFIVDKTDKKVMTLIFLMLAELLGVAAIALKGCSF